MKLIPAGGRTYITIAVLLIAALAITASISLSLQLVYAAIEDGAQLRDSTSSKKAAPVAISGEDVYVAWPTNNTANNNEVMFRASTDGGATYGEKINLSNTTNADSTRAEIDADADSVVVTWWESNQTSDAPVMRVSTDNGGTFGPMLALATNGTIGAEEGE